MWELSPKEQYVWYASLVILCKWRIWLDFLSCNSVLIHITMLKEIEMRTCKSLSSCDETCKRMYYHALSTLLAECVNRTSCNAWLLSFCTNVDMTILKDYISTTTLWSECMEEKKKDQNTQKLEYIPNTQYIMLHNVYKSKRLVL